MEDLRNRPEVKGLDGQHFQVVEFHMRYGFSRMDSMRKAGFADDEHLKKKTNNLFQRKQIKDAIQLFQLEMLRVAAVTPEDVQRELACLGFSNIADYIDIDQETGEVEIDIRNASREQLAAVKEIKTETRMVAGVPITRTILSLHPKQPALDSLAKQLGMLNTALTLVEGQTKDISNQLIEHRNNRPGLETNHEHS